MTFGEVPIDQALGSILAHSVGLQKGRLRKGLTLDAEHLALLQASGIEAVTVATLGDDDWHENSAAQQVAEALSQSLTDDHMILTDAFTGRVNVIAATQGVAVIDADKINALNRIDPMLTLATVPPYQQMRKGGMIATIKIISYGVGKAVVQQAQDIASGAIRLAPPVYTSAGLILTQDSYFEGDKGQAAVQSRLDALGIALEQVTVVPHDAAHLTRAIQDTDGEMLLILTQTATSDINDTGPAALRAAGGQVTRFGMPVDPGNLLFLGAYQNRPVIGLPGCARSPALNGADWVLSRVACGIEVSDADIAGMGVGGLLKEIPTRPQPRRG